MNEAAEIQRAETLLQEGRNPEALAITGALVASSAPSHLALAAHSSALKLSGRSEAALTFDRQAIDRFGSSPIAWHNYAATLDDLGRAEEAVEACEQAFRLGMDAAQTFSVYARASRAVGNHDRADYAYKQSLLRAPATLGVATEYSNYVWMRTGDLQAADAVLDRAFHAGAPPTSLLVSKATLYDAAGQTDRAVDLLDAASVRIPNDTLILMTAIDFALRSERIDDARRFADAALALQPDSRSTLQHSAIVDLAQDRGDTALAKIKRALEAHPDDQSLWGWAAVAARAVGDPLYNQLFDYENLVATYELAPPKGWSTTEGFLADLAKALKEKHKYSQHPANQSLRHGSQTMHLLTGSSDPAIKGFFEAVDAPIREHMRKLGQGGDPLRRRNTFDYWIQGAWSVRLQPHGYHRDHFHPFGWLSSAFYVETPEAALDSPDREGWIRFGQPPFITNPAQPAEHYVRPKPGRLVLFPSYMWHGTVPFTTDETRMTIAFDAAPK